jgi:hypothetical protein
MDDRPNVGFNYLYLTLTCCFTDTVILKITFKTEWRNVSIMDFAVYTTLIVRMNVFLGYENICQVCSYATVCSRALAYHGFGW